jgi:hypothetical protein
MPDSSVEELKRRIAAGEYAIDSGNLADTIISKIGVIKRVKRSLASAGEDPATRKRVEALELEHGPRRGPHRKGSDRETSDFPNSDIE